MKHDPRVITVSSEKGGVGKSTFALNLAHGIALTGRRVLGVDLDSHAGLTTLANLPRNNGAATLLRLRSNYSLPSSSEYIQSFILPAPQENLFILPGGKETQDEPTPVEKRGMDYLKKLLRLFDPLNFDYIFLDTGPASDPIQARANFAADYILIPTTPGRVNISGMNELLVDIQNLKSHDQIADDGSGPIRWEGKILGIVLNRYEERVKGSQEAAAELQEYFPDFSLPPVHEAAIYVNADNAGMSVFEYEPRSRAANEMRQLVELILSKE